MSTIRWGGNNGNSSYTRPRSSIFLLIPFRGEMNLTRDFIVCPFPLFLYHVYCIFYTTFFLREKITWEIFYCMFCFLSLDQCWTIILAYISVKFFQTFLNFTLHLKWWDKNKKVRAEMNKKEGVHKGGTGHQKSTIIDIISPAIFKKMVMVLWLAANKNENGTMVVQWCSLC